MENKDYFSIIVEFLRVVPRRCSVEFSEGMNDYFGSDSVEDIIEKLHNSINNIESYRRVGVVKAQLERYEFDEVILNFEDKVYRVKNRIVDINANNSDIDNYDVYNYAKSEVLLESIIENGRFYNTQAKMFYEQGWFDKLQIELDSFKNYNIEQIELKRIGLIETENTIKLLYAIKNLVLTTISEPQKTGAVKGKKEKSEAEKKPNPKQKKVLKLIVEEMKKGTQKTDAINDSYPKAGYKSDRQIWTIVGKVEKGELIFKEFTEILE